jgi:TonB family protein
MRRTILHISLALLTFTIGLLASGTDERFTVALLVALTVFILLKRITCMGLTLHHLKVAVLTLLIWTPFAALTLNLVTPTTSCVVDLPEEATTPVAESDQPEPPVVTTEPRHDSFNSSTYYNGTDDLTPNTIWVGVVDSKAISKPAPRYPAEAKAARIESTVAVAVIIDAATGMVIEAQPLSGHPRLRQAAIEAAYQARFYPTRACLMPPNVSGILTYKFPGSSIR